MALEQKLPGRVCKFMEFVMIQRNSEYEINFLSYRELGFGASGAIWWKGGAPSMYCDPS